MAIGILGLCLTVLGIILAYIWKGNQKMEKALLTGQEAILVSQERLMAGQERLMAGQERLMAGQERLEEGQREGFKEIAQILKDHTEMFLAQTRILERIEGKILTGSAG